MSEDREGSCETVSARLGPGARLIDCQPTNDPHASYKPIWGTFAVAAGVVLVVVGLGVLAVSHQGT